MIRYLTLFYLIFGFSFLSLPATAQDTPDDRYDSDNVTTTVRPPVLESKPASFKKSPYKITRSELKKIDPKPIPTDKLNELSRINFQDALVLGKVESVHIPQSGNRVILNFGKDHRQCFKVVIQDRDFEKFGHKAPQRIGAIYQGKTVLVSGLVSQHQNLPQIMVTLPYQLEVVAGQ